MTRYLLDTNVITELEDKAKPSFKSISSRLAGLENEDEVYISILTAYEYQHGIAKASGSLKEDLRLSWNNFEDKFPILPLSLEGARLYGALKARYEQRTGASGGNMQKRTIDFILAGSALEIGAILVSNDSIFNNIKKIQPSLQVENWSVGG